MNAICDREKMLGLWETLFDGAVDEHENFFERGDSLSAHILLASIERELGVRVDFVSLVEAPTIAGLLDVIARIRTSGV